jgi:hypothetical protein
MGNKELVSKEKYDTCRLNGFGKNYTINFFPLSFVSVENVKGPFLIIAPLSTL